MSRITPFQIAMGTGTAGALEDVSTYADLAAGVQRSWGRQTEFEDIAPGVFSFVLDNSDGRFTPGNTNSPLTTKVTEGMSVCWNAGGRLVAGTILAIEPTFPNDESAWAQIRITCDDMLGAAGRREIPADMRDAQLQAAGQFLLWPLTDEAGASSAAESQQTLYGPQPIYYAANGSSFGADPLSDDLPGTTLSLVAGDKWGLTKFAPNPGFVYPTKGRGFFGFWTIPSSSNAISVDFRLGSGLPVYVNWDGTKFDLTDVFISTVSYTPGAGFKDRPHYVAMGWVNTTGNFYTGKLYIDGSAVATMSAANYGTSKPWPTEITISATTGTTRFGRVSHSAQLAREDYILASDEATVLTAVDSLVPTVSLSLSSDLSTAPVRPAVAGSVLDLLNEVIRTEQGTVYSAVTGTLTSPTQTLTVRERTRPTTVTASWDVSRELDGAPQFVRDVTNMVSEITASGPTQDLTVTDSTLTDRVGSANSTESVMNTNYVDLLSWSQDRLQRGANVNIRIAAVTIDAMTTPTDRTSDLLALVPGDRHQFTGLPSTQLGFSTWDGWLLGADELHTLTEHTFTLYFQPVLPRTAIFDTDYYGADGALTCHRPSPAAQPQCQ